LLRAFTKASENLNLNIIPQSLRKWQLAVVVRYQLFASAKAKWPPPKPGAKRNHGRTGTVFIFFDPELCRKTRPFESSVDFLERRLSYIVGSRYSSLNAR